MAKSAELQIRLNTGFTPRQVNFIEDRARTYQTTSGEILRRAVDFIMNMNESERMRGLL